jgi:integrase
MEFVQPIRERKKIEAMKKVLSKNKRDLLMFVLGINCGLRISDILKIKVNDVLTEKGKAREFVELREEKTGKSRRIVFADNVQKAIMDYLKGFSGTNEELDRPLFLSRKSDKDGDNKALSRQMAYNIINEAAQCVGIDEKIGTHTLRKTFGFHAYKGSTDIVLLQLMFNHSSPSVTLRYIGIVQDDIDNVLINLNL